MTLSPLTDMAYKFHSKNGAKLVQVNETTQNFEYQVTKSLFDNFSGEKKLKVV